MDNKKILNQFKRINKALNSQKEILDELLKKNNKDCFYFQPIHWLLKINKLGGKKWNKKHYNK